jgi:hypothetical protein
MRLRRSVECKTARCEQEAHGLANDERGSAAKDMEKALGLPNAFAQSVFPAVLSLGRLTPA